ncbi:MAG: glycosyltransferase family 4 protein [Actinomycetota bacterium]
MVRGATVAVVRPDHGVMGGFERHLLTVMNGLVERGWNIRHVGLDAKRPKAGILGLPIQPVQHEFHDDYFKYLSVVDQVAELDLSRFDLVLTTQPPTYLVDHHRKVALFYHQARQFYDLSGAYLTSGFATDEIHGAAERSVRRIDRVGVGDVRHWLAGSATAAARLRQYWSVPEDRISIYQAPPACEIPPTPPPYEPGGPLLHVGRMEWPKRPELLVNAIHLMTSDRACVFVGDGSREELVRSLDAELGARGGTVLPEHRTWLNRGIYTAGWQPYDGPSSGRIGFIGSVDNAARDRSYQAAAAVIAPAYNEDYGLTALEAMAFARPVIVCRDGGGLTELVEHGRNGLIVDPDPRSLAAAIDQLLADPAGAAELGRAGFETVRAITEDRAISQVEQTLEKALAD